MARYQNDRFVPDHQMSIHTHAGLIENYFVSCPAIYAGAVLGLDACMLRWMMNKTRAYLTVERFPIDGQSLDDDIRWVKVTASPKSAEKAIDFIYQILSEREGIAMQRYTNRTVIEVPTGLLGRIIGRNGATIRDVMDQSGARIKFNQEREYFRLDYLPIYVDGTCAAVGRAVALINDIAKARRSSDYNFLVSSYPEYDRVTGRKRPAKFVRHMNRQIELLRNQLRESFPDPPCTREGLEED